MKAIVSCVLFASLLVRALPSPDSAITLLAAQIDPDCTQCPIVSVSVLGIAGDETTYELFGIPASIETLIEGPAGYTLMHVDNTVLIHGTRVLTAEDDCTFAGTSAANCVQHYDTAVSTVTGAPLKAIETVTPAIGAHAASGSGPAPTNTGSNGSVRTGDVRIEIEVAAYPSMNVSLELEAEYAWQGHEAFRFLSPMPAGDPSVFTTRAVKGKRWPTAYVIILWFSGGIVRIPLVRTSFEQKYQLL
ncbi:hypothetical protein DFH09DRAFT_1087596 [Mycena vulgaris]|nr:hypothetical protein DFH09DRAFT_1087596 [Mycena vulgaris]